jgi:serine/threonine-protein kinase
MSTEPHGAATPEHDGPSDALPRTFGRYVLFDLVGRGGMAEIFLARARTTEAGGARLVVVKQILPELSASAKFSEAFVGEAKLAARLSHANVVQVLDLGRAPSQSMPPAPLDADGQTIPVSMRPTPVAPHSRLFIAMEYVEGLDLNELLRRCTSKGSISTSCFVDVRARRCRCRFSSRS